MTGMYGRIRLFLLKHLQKCLNCDKIKSIMKNPYFFTGRKVDVNAKEN